MWQISAPCLGNISLQGLLSNLLKLTTVNDKRFVGWSKELLEKIFKSTERVKTCTQKRIISIFSCQISELIQFVKKLIY